VVKNDPPDKIKISFQDYNAQNSSGYSSMRKDNIPENDRITEYRFSQGKIVGELAKKAYPEW